MRSGGEKPREGWLRLARVEAELFALENSGERTEGSRKRTVWGSSREARHLRNAWGEEGKPLRREKPRKVAGPEPRYNSLLGETDDCREQGPGVGRLG
jgi:hypothetical protein